MKQREPIDLEYKRELSSTYLKTVSAFANYGGGTIAFGFDDDGTLVGLDNPKQVSLDIENQINDNIKPIPNFTLQIDGTEMTVILTVEEGLDKPYVYRNKAYRRADTSTVEVDRSEYNRLILKGLNEQVEEMPARRQDLTFTYLEPMMRDSLGIDDLSKDVQKTLNLFSDKKGYNRAAELFSDQNGNAGIDIAVFGKSIDVFIDRIQYNGTSILQQYDDALGYIVKRFTYEQVIDAKRERVELIPIQAIREALANAIVHRIWDNQAPIRVSIHSDRVEIMSPGGLPTDITTEEYLYGRISLLRNPIIANVFFRLSIIEAFGTGVLRIMQAYEDSFVKPSFIFTPNTLTVTLPITTNFNDLDTDERAVLSEMRKLDIPVKRVDLEKELQISKAKLIRILNTLLEKNIIERIGAGPGVMYRIL